MDNSLSIIHGLRYPGVEVAWRQRARCMADHIFVTSFLSGKSANTAQYSMILLGQSDLRRPPKNYISLTDQARLCSLTRGRASGDKGLLFDTKWWILENYFPILKSIQARAKSNSTKKSKESECYMYIFITYLQSFKRACRQLKFTMQERHEVSFYQALWVTVSMWRLSLLKANFKIVHSTVHVQLNRVQFKLVKLLLDRGTRILQCTYQLFN